MKNIGKYFSAFGKILVLAAVFFYSNSNSKSIWKLIFPAFGKTFLLAAAFFYSNSNLKSLGKMIFWEDLGFGGCLFSFDFLRCCDCL